MIGAAIIIVVLVIAIPVAVLLTGMIFAGIFGSVLTADGEANASDPSLVEINR